ncbi:hypothetical protein GBO31_22605, partial [Aquimarina litoralis]|nr:hypothetical protein [Aquimarina litoralis]
MRPLAKCCIWILLFCCFYESFGQVVIGNREFETRAASELNIRGDLVLIGNAVTGLDSNPNGDNNTPGNNNGQSVAYIDIDGFVDEDGDLVDDTFGSSSADLILPSGCEQIRYAGLYWTATYYIEKSDSNNPITQGLPLPDPRPDFRSVKLRVPGAANYVDVPVATNRGVIYDGYRNTATNPNDRAAKDIPYVCYADVTDIVTSLADPRGTYTVANVRSAIGPSGPGIASGWTLVLVYEDPTDTEKFISTRDGFRQIGSNDPPVTFLYDNFQTLPAPLPVNARYGIAALEGDTNFTGDGLAIFSQPLGNFEIPLFADPVNDVTNFFNSSVSVDGAYNTARSPASENTLGFDLDIFDIPNTGNTIIGNNQTSVEFSLSTAGDSYSAFLSTFAVEVIEPDLTVFKRVLDNNAVDITGGDVVLGQQLFYELTIENQGNEDITNAFIDDILPANVDFVGGTITTPAGVTATLLNGNREVRFDFDDGVVERFDAPLTIRFGVEVVASCADLRDACSNEIENIATSTYTGVISGITRSGEGSVLSQDACRFVEPGASNFLIDLDSCDGNFSAFLCTGTLDLVAGGGFPNYVWTDLGTGMVVGNMQTLTVSASGVYRVDKTGNPDCNDLFEIWTVTAFNTVTNPIVPIAQDPSINGNVRTCPITGDPLPEIFLCGATDSQYLDSGFVDATNIVWERLDPAACPSVTRDEDCPTLDSTCDPDWVQVATTRDFTVTEAGEYRIRVEFDGNCEIDFYFNVFKNNFEPNLVIVRDIV